MSSDERAQGSSQEDKKRAVADMLKDIPSFNTLIAAAAKLVKEVKGMCPWNKLLHRQPMRTLLTVNCLAPFSCPLGRDRGKYKVTAQ